MPSSRSPSKVVTGSGRLPVSSVVSSAASAAFLLEGDYGDLIVSDRGTALHIQDGVVANARLKSMPANTVKVRDSATEGVPSDLPIEPNTVLGRAGLNIVADKLQRDQIAEGAVDNARAAEMPANTVKVNSSNGLSSPSDLPIDSDTVLGRRSSGNIVAGKVTTNQIEDNAITYDKIRLMGANSVIGNPSVNNLSPVTIGIAPDTVLGRVGSANIGPTKVASTQIADDAVDNIRAANMGGNTVKVNDTAAPGDPVDLVLGPNTVLGRGSTGNIVAGQVVATQIADDAVDNVRAANMNPNTVKVNNTASPRDPVDLPLGTHTVLGRAGGNIVSAQVVGTQIADKAISTTKLRDSLGSSVLGRASASSGVPDDIVAGANTVFGRSGSGELGFSGIYAFVPEATELVRGVVALADTGDVRDGVSNVVSTPISQHWHPTHPKARCKIHSALNTILHDYGVSSIVDEGPGTVHIYFDVGWELVSLMVACSVRNSHVRTVVQWTVPGAVQVTIYHYNSSTPTDPTGELDVAVWSYSS